MRKYLLDLVVGIKSIIFPVIQVINQKKGPAISKMPPLSARQGILLAFLSSDPQEALDPVRIMKGMFIFCQEAPNEWLAPRQRYKFSPYNYGPFSKDVYRDLECLADQRLVIMNEVAGRSWKQYSLSSAGIELISNLSKDMRPKSLSFLKDIRQWVSSLSFRALLSEIYKKYPKFASSSILTNF